MNRHEESSKFRIRGLDAQAATNPQAGDTLSSQKDPKAALPCPQTAFLPSFIGTVFQAPMKEGDRLFIRPDVMRLQARRR
jgi:hypothetical protein